MTLESENPHVNLGLLQHHEKELIRNGELSQKQKYEILMMIARNSCLILARLRQRSALGKILDKLLSLVGIG
jgi:hypothetical protein